MQQLRLFQDRIPSIIFVSHKVLKKGTNRQKVWISLHFTICIQIISSSVPFYCSGSSPKRACSASQGWAAHSLQTVLFSKPAIPITHKSPISKSLRLYTPIRKLRAGFANSGNPDSRSFSPGALHIGLERTKSDQDGLHLLERHTSPLREHVRHFVPRATPE